MPLSPTECKIHRRNTAKPALEFHCGRIDEMLMRSSQHEYWFDTRGIDGEVLCQIESTYEAAGWDVRRVSDQRDGDALVFKERK